MTTLASFSPVPLVRLQMEMLRLLPNEPVGTPRPGLREIILAVTQMAQVCDALWNGCCTLALVNRAAEAQELRQDVFASYAHIRQIMGEVIQSARSQGFDGPEIQRLEAEAAALEQKSNRLSARWQTVEDLEDLAAESIEIPAEKIEAIRRKYGFPQAWYDEDSKPF